MNLDNLTSIDQLAEFLSGTQAVAFSVLSRPAARYEWVQKTLVRFGYLTLSRPHQGIVIRVLMKVSGYSRQQITRLIAQYRKNGTLRRRQRTVAGFLSKYTPADIRLLAAMDERHDTPCGPAVKKLCERAWRLFGQTEYERLASISVSHLYNLRKSLSYTRHRRHFEKTRPRQVPIGERRKPASNGQPGYLRIDTVHQGDWDGKKGVYHVNAVDEVTQCEVVCTLEKISESYLIPVLEQLLEAFPFTVLGFHSDNGSEYINKRVAQLLEKLLIEFTKSRSRQSNGRVGDWRGAHTSRGVAVTGQVRCLNPPHVSRFQSPLVEPDVQISRIRLSRISLRPSLSPRRPGCRGAYRGRASRRDTRMGIGDTPWCLASLVAGPSTAADGSRCTSGSPGMRG